jgi:catechol 2,3-dioxygenase-like lactoylglutathione lyase family enzyme
VGRPLGQPRKTEANMAQPVAFFASFAVDDIDTAKIFYRETLGMSVSEEGGRGPLWLHGQRDHDVLVYRKPDHVPATFTVLNVAVDDIDKAVDDLAAKGVRFERYDALETDDRGIYRAEGHSTAWFTDPAGNVLSVVQLA